MWFWEASGWLFTLQPSSVEVAAKTNPGACVRGNMQVLANIISWIIVDVLLNPHKKDPHTFLSLLRNTLVPTVILILNHDSFTPSSISITPQEGTTWRYGCAYEWKWPYLGLNLYWFFPPSGLFFFYIFGNWICDIARLTKSPFPTPKGPHFDDLYWFVTRQGHPKFWKDVFEAFDQPATSQKGTRILLNLTAWDSSP